MTKRLALGALCAAALFAQPAGAAELRILSAGAAKPVIADAIPDFERRTGHTIAVDYTPVGPILKRLADGEQRDIVVLSAETMNEAAAKGWVAPESAAEVGRVGIGVAVREGAPRPDIATPEAFKRALLAAASVAYVDPERSTSGRHFAAVMETLGIAAAIKPKSKTLPGGFVAELVAKGEVELAVHQITEILPVKGVVLVGPLPPELQKVTIYQAAATTKARDAEAARAFLANLRSAEVRALAAKKGFTEP
ncbi:MAG: substrate-binding domain-containing protein [Alphaproteobacteria bacterium]